MLQSVDWYLVTVVLGQPIGPWRYRSVVPKRR